MPSSRRYVRCQYVASFVGCSFISSSSRRLDDERRPPCLAAFSAVLRSLRCCPTLPMPPGNLPMTPPTHSTAKHQQVKTKIFLSHSRCVPTYGLPQTGLCNKVWVKVRSAKFDLFHTQVKLRVCFGMQFDVLDAPPYVWPYFVSKSSLG